MSTTDGGDETDDVAARSVDYWDPAFWDGVRQVTPEEMGTVGTPVTGEWVFCPAPRVDLDLAWAPEGSADDGQTRQ